MLPVMSGPRELACIILERVSVRDLVLHGVHMDLSRTLEAVINTQKREQHAANLGLLVEARTRELLAEVTGRRLAEEELHRVVGFLKEGGQYSDAEVVDLVVRTCFEGLAAR